MYRKIHIAYLIDTICSDKAGTEKQLLNIIKHLDQENFDVTLFCLHASPWLFSNKLPCEVINLGYRGFLKPNFPIVLQRYLRLLNEKQFDIVQTFFEDSIFLGFLGKKLSTKKHSLIVSRRDLGLGADEPGYHRFYKKLLPYIFNYADGIATNAMAIKTHLMTIDSIPAEKIRVIGNGIDVPSKPLEPPKLFVDHKADLWIGIVANLKPIKRIDLFLRALACLNTDENGNKFRAVVLGEGHLRSELEQLASELGIPDRVHFMGTQANVSDYLHFLDIGVLCSDKEGLSNAIMEYMACGLPVVATATGGNCELVNESNGICVPVGDFVALGDALHRLIASAHLREEFGAQSIIKIKENFSWNMIMTKWESYYHSLISRP
jgi:glycosyltransferase involved in cell wall biosynthesis